jgi:thiamine-phosphate pyrophosphorylase
MVLPRLYAIVDVTCFAAQGQITEVVVAFARRLVEGGVSLIQYRDKAGNVRDMLGRARELRRCLGNEVALVMNDRADLCLAAGYQGLHVGTDDLTPGSARAIVGPSRILGVSTHNLEQVRQADKGPADYIAFGPIFPTRSKERPDPVIGVEGLREARSATRKPLVAIGGITRANARSVIDAGADSVAIISDLLESPKGAAQELLRLLV